ncbi:MULTISPECIES: MFS transporter [Nocardiaceae]|jgi:MFS family permease|uniref:MFS transporter n=1 Tax=Nocardiaceae TaxID=85025 RepID=UPI0005663102|nr:MULTISPECIES: MFS transporter [Rhodococcus]OZE96427.1 MFS transporter [Rhodococcus sp. 15-1189-1-1a]OZF11014.1 MFS transporter [Rhodococcus sp. 14-2686-1-2]OZF47783.1 MFS transporter [Rhodococcus sp. 14-2470-1b]
MSTTAPPPDNATVAPAGVVVAVLAFTGIVVSLMQTLIIPLIPQLPTLLDASASNTAWAITATLLAGAVAVPVMGRLGDMFGKRLLLMASLVLMISGSIVGALSESLVPLVVGRALQGLAAGVIPLGISIMRDVLPREKLAGATATMGASLGVGGALGLPAAALIAEYADWHFLFWVSAALGVIVAILVLTLVPESEVRTGGTFDAVGAASLSVALVTLLLSISKGATWGWSSSTTLGLLAVAVVSLGIWGWWELRTKQPLVDLRVSARRQVLLTNLASVVFGFAMFAMTLVFPQVLQLPVETGFGLGRSMLVTGLVMAPSGIVMMLVAPISSKITTTRGPKTTLMLGAIVVAVGYLFGVVTMSAVWQLVAISCIIGAGIGLSYGAMPALIMGAVPPSETAAANSLNTLMRSLGTSTASAVAGVILAQMTITLGSAELPSQQGFRVTMAVAAGASLIALALAAFLPRFAPAAPSRQEYAPVKAATRP